MFDPQLIGLAGLVLLVIAWIPHTIACIKNHLPVDLKFNLIYFFGAFCLMVYAYLINNLIFTLLNLCTTAMALLNVYYNLKNGKK